MIIKNLCEQLINENQSITDYFKNNEKILNDLYFDPKKVDKSDFDTNSLKYKTVIQRLMNNYIDINLEELVLSYISEFEKDLNCKLDNQVLYIIVGYNTTTIYSTLYNNQKVTVLLLESTEDLEYLKMLLAHEITHWIRSKKFNYDIFESSIGERFITEGIACNYSKEIIPNKEDNYYCIVPRETVEWCKNNITLLENKSRDYLKDNTKMYDFFYMFANIDFPVRTGYVYGYLKVREYLEKSHLMIKDIIEIKWDDILNDSIELN